MGNFRSKFLDEENVDLELIKESAYRERERREELKSKFEKKQGGLWEFCKYSDPRFFFDVKKALVQVSYLLEEAFYRNIKMLIISIMPRVGKSYLVSQFCSWGLGRKPTESVMRVTSTQFLSDKLSSDVKTIISREKIKNVFGINISSDKYSDTAWKLKGAREFSYFCAGVEGPIMGLGASLFAIIDDHVKNWKQSTSRTIMNNHFEWYLSTFKTRVEDGCPEILIGTRFTKKDIIGRILDKEKEKVKNGEIVNVMFPALIDGMSFCEGTMNTSFIIERKQAYEKHGMEYIWSPVYMQKPISPISCLFPLSQLRFAPYGVIVEEERAYIAYVDPADKGDDFLACGIFYSYFDGIYLADVIYTQRPLEETVERIASFIKTHKPVFFEAESNKEGRSLSLLITQLLVKDDIKPPEMSWKNNTSNKNTRIMMNSGVIKNKIYFRSDYKNYSEYESFINDLTEYDSRKTDQIDDAPDMLAGVAAKVLSIGDMEIESH